MFFYELKCIQQSYSFIDRPTNWTIIYCYLTEYAFTINYK
ncbi:unnamed protein product [Schistosoma mattheei]|uniref:Uncharacterized protein n=1 Tax=Schistosoma mattheei TaxID=31246 RepID=A0A183P895_9TREM|nr:unnamed protein product [Schistosoma mattheei]